MYIYNMYVYINMHIDRGGTNTADELSSLDWNWDTKWATCSHQWPWMALALTGRVSARKIVKGRILETSSEVGYKLVYKAI